MRSSTVSGAGRRIMGLLTDEGVLQRGPDRLGGGCC